MKRAIKSAFCANFIAVILVAFTLLFSACEKLIIDKEIENTAKENFEYLWKQVNDKYAFLDYKKVDWEETRRIYGAKITDNMSKEELFDVLAEMLNSLRDGHVNLSSSFNTSHYDPHLLGVENINSRLVLEKYLNPNFYSSQNFRHNFIHDKKIGYIRYSSFNSGLLDDSELEYIFNRYQDTEGVIIDIRQNGGGIMQNVGALLARFTNEKMLVYTSEVKSGPGRNDFTEIKKAYVDTLSYSYGEDGDLVEAVKYNKHVAILVDRGSYSASSFFALSTKAYDKLFLVGDTTGGGLGLPNGGQLPNGWTYRFSITRTLDIDGNNYEDGVPPDILEILDPEQVAAGKDNVIERAAHELLKRAK